MVIPPHYRGLTVSEVNGKYEQGTITLFNLCLRIYVLFPVILIFWPCIITVLRYLLFAHPINSVLAFHSFPFFFIPFSTSFHSLIKLHSRSFYAPNASFPSFQCSDCSPLDIYRARFPKFL